MKKIFVYCCRNCRHMWKDEKRFDICPECKSKDIDVNLDIYMED